jgi:N-acetylmuramoyl-L-alanine amidase
MDMKNLIVKKNTKMLKTQKILNKLTKPILLVLAIGCWFVAIAQTPDLKTIVIDPGHGGVDVGAGGRYSREAMVALQISLKLRDLMVKEIPDVKVLMTRETDILPGNLSDRNAALRWRANFANTSGADLFVSIHLNSSPSNQKYGRRQIGTKEETYYVKSGKGSKAKKIKKTRTVPVYERYRLPPAVLGTQTYVLASDYYKGKVAAAGKSADVRDFYENDSSAVMEEVDPVEARIRAQQYAKYFFQKSLTLATYVEEEFGSIGRYSMGVWQRDWANAAGIYVLTATQMPSILVETGFIDHPDEENYLNSSEGQEQMAKSILNAIKRYREVLNNPEKLIQENASTD